MEETFYFDILKRIGSTSRDQLAWLIGVLEGPVLQTPEDWVSLRRGLLVFAMHAAGAPSYGLTASDIDFKPLTIPIVTSSKTMREALKKAQWGVMWAVLDMLERVASRQTFVSPQQETRVQWSEGKRRYVSVIDPARDSFRKAIIRGLTKCVFDNGRLVKECQAPGKVKTGRKRKGESEPMPSVCGKLFVGRKENQLYCSGACLSRTLTRKKRASKKTRGRKIGGRKQARPII